MNIINCTKTLLSAVIPSRAHPTDVGMDLVCIAEKKRTWDSNENLAVITYDTGIAVAPPDGYYTEIVPRSSMSKSGWMLANGVGIVDPSYRGSLKVALVRVVDGAPEPQLPFCLTQLVLRRAEYGEMKAVDDLSTTVRGKGGFGSTGDRTG
jgi:dUTP pyrophosphatase